MNSFVPSEVVARFRATSRKLLRPKLPFSARIVSNRSRGSAGLSPRTPCGHSSRSSEAPAARDGDPRNRPNRYRSSRVDCEHVGLLWPRTAALNSAGPSCANGCSASVAARFSRVVSVLDAAHPRWTPRPAPLPRRPRQWDGHARAAAPCSEETSVHAAAFRGGHPGPLTGARHLDIESRGGLTSGQLVVAVDSANSPPDPRIAIGLVDFTGTTSWTAMPRFLADDRLTDPGVYYLKIAFFADSATNPVSVGFDNVRLAWTTDAAVVVYLPSPAPFVLFFTQDKTLFISYFAFLAAVIFLAAGYHLIRERREAWNAFRAPLEAIGTRLKSRSAWIALGQVWMAVTFFQVVFYYLVIAAGINPSSPVNPTPQSAWFWLYELLNAGVYEEFAFRILLIGLPMAIGSVVLRIIEVNRGGTGSGPGAAGRHIGGAWRDLIGGAVRRDSPEETLVAAWAFLLARPAIFGLAHAPGWGLWQVIPAMVAGLRLGFLVLRPRVAAAPASVAGDAVWRAARRRGPQCKSHPPGVYAFVRPASIRVSPGPIPMPVLRVGRSQVRRGPFHVHAVRPDRLAFRSNSALRDVVDRRLQVVGLDLHRDVPQGRRGREVHDANERRLLAQAHRGAIPSTTGEQLTPRGVSNPLCADQLTKPVEVLCRPDDSALRRFDAHIGKHIPQRGHHFVRIFRRMNRRLDANAMHLTRFAPSPLIFSGCLGHATKVF